MKLADIKYQVAMTAAFVLSGGQFTDIATHRHGAVAACSGLLQQQHVQQIIPPPPGANTASYLLGTLFICQG